MKQALILVDIQNDFMPGGALPVTEGDRIVPIVNAMQKHFELVVATQDWHPANHGSFASQHPGMKAGDVIVLNGLSQVLWPDHCVQGSRGAAFHPALDMRRAKVFQKGTDPGIDSYSGFYDNNHRRGTGLAEYLEEAAVREVFLCGLATDYCVKFTALDARYLRLTTHLVVDACRGVNLSPGDVDQAIGEMRAADVNVVTSASVIGTVNSMHA